MLHYCRHSGNETDFFRLTRKNILGNANFSNFPATRKINGSRPQLLQTCTMHIARKHIYTIYLSSANMIDVYFRYSSTRRKRTRRNYIAGYRYAVPKINVFCYCTHITLPHKKCKSLHTNTQLYHTNYIQYYI